MSNKTGLCPYLAVLKPVGSSVVKKGRTTQSNLLLIAIIKFDIDWSCYDNENRSEVESKEKFALEVCFSFLNDRIFIKYNFVPLILFQLKSGLAEVFLE